jgi:hypothetical protein
MEWIQLLVAIVALLGGLKHLQGEILRRIDRELVPAINHLTAEIATLRERMVIVETRMSHGTASVRPPNGGPPGPPT